MFIISLKSSIKPVKFSIVTFGSDNLRHFSIDNLVDYLIQFVSIGIIKDETLIFIGFSLNTSIFH